RQLLKHPNAKLDAEVLLALRLGAFQLLHMDRIPAHAAIDESVEITKQAGHRFASGMVNAVLRKLAASRTEQEAQTLVEEDWRLVEELAPGGGTILDCCDAPGGTTLILAERNPDARIVACESSPQRLAQLRKRVAALGDRVGCRLADVATLEDDAAYDVV